MKITGHLHYPATFPVSKTLKPTSTSDIKPTRRKTRNRSLTRLSKPRVPGQRGSRPETPLLRWKVEDKGRNRKVEAEEEEAAEVGRKNHRKHKKGSTVVSARKLAAGLWRFQLPEYVAGAGAESLDRFGFQHEPSFLFLNSAMEGVTKWDPVCLKTTDKVRQIYSHIKHLDQQVSAVSIVAAFEAEVEQARARIQELETECQSSKKKLEHFSRKVSKEKAAWRSREHEKNRAFIDDLKAELSRERKNRQRMEIVNSKLVNELSDAKLSAKRYVQDYEKERKARELIEEVCDELAKEIEEDKAEVGALKRESMKLREEVEDERKMLQMAEVWREERVQMKLVDAKVALEERYSQMNKLVAELETFLRSQSMTPDVKGMKEAESLLQAVASMNIQNIEEFTYEPPNPDNVFSIFEDVNFAEHNEREIEQCGAYSPVSHASKIHTVSPEINAINKDGIRRHCNAYFDHNADLDEDESGWETVSHLEDQGSSCSPERSAPFIKNRRDSNFSGSVMEWEDNGYEGTPITEISEVCSVLTKPLKKVSSIARLWKSCPKNGDNYKIITVEGTKGRLSVSNGRLPNGESCISRAGVR